MSAEATGWVFRHSPLKGVAFTIHLAIADSVNDQNDFQFWMKAENLAVKARTSRETVTRKINEMIEMGLLSPLDEGEIDFRKSMHQARLVRFEMPDSDVTRDHIDPHPDVTSDHIGCDERSHRDVTSDHIQGTQERTQDQTQNPSLSSKLDEGGVAPTLPGLSPSPSQQESAEPKLTREQRQAASARVVFDEWVEVTGRDPKRVKLNRARRDKIVARLNEGYTEEELVQAVRGSALSPWHQGENPRRRVYNDLLTLLRDGPQVEKFRDLYLGEGGSVQPIHRVDRILSDLYGSSSTPAWDMGQRAIGGGR